MYDLYRLYGKFTFMLTMLKSSYECTNKGHLLEGLVVFVPCVQFGSHPYPFRAVLMFNVRFGVVTLRFMYAFFYVRFFFLF